MKSMILSMFGVLLFTSGFVAQSTQPAGEAFSWNGELVALDDAARMMTVKVRVVGEQTAAELGRLKTGEHVVLTWSGYDKSADAIREVRSAAANKFEQRFAFPAEVVSFDGARRYLTFKVQIPQNSLANLKPLKPGEWVTATSPHGSAAKANPIVTVRPYVEHGSVPASN